MKNQSLFEQLQKGIGDAVADIREKVVEEGYFGRAVTDKEQSPAWPEAKDQEQPGGFGSLSTHKDVGWPQAKEQEQQAPEQKHDRGINLGHC